MSAKRGELADAVPFLVLLGIVLLLLRPLGTGITGLQILEPQAALSACGAVTESSTLTQNVSSTGTCFDISSDNVEFDCQGFSITGSQTGFGINATDRKNITIRNCNVLNYSNNIRFLRVNQSSILDSTSANSTSTSITISSSRNINFAGNTARAFFGTIIFTSSHNNSVTGNNITSDASEGILFSSSSNNTIRDNIASNLNGNTYAIKTSGSSASGFNSIVNNTAFNGILVQILGGAVDEEIINNTLSESNGLEVDAENATVFGNRVNTSAGAACSLSVTRLLFSNNECESSGGQGIGIGSSFFSISDLVILNNTGKSTSSSSEGIKISSGSNVIFDSNNGISLFEGTGISITATNITFNNSLGISNGSTGIDFSGASSIFTNNIGLSNGSSSGIAGISLSGSASDNVFGNFIGTCNGACAGILISSLSSGNVGNCSGTSTNGAGISVTGSSPSNISGCTAFGEYGAGLAFVGASGSIVRNVQAMVESGFGLLVNSSSFGTPSTNNIVDNVTASSINYTAVYFQSGANNIISNSTFFVDRGFALAFGIPPPSAPPAQNNSIEKVTLVSNSSWILVDENSTGNNITNLRFETPSGGTTIALQITLPVFTNITSNFLNVSSNKVFLNASSLAFLNTSANITLTGINFTDPAPIVDFEDDGSFVDCPADVCTEQSFAGGSYTFNVSHFTSYSSKEATAAPAPTPTPAPSGGGGAAAPSRRITDCFENWMCGDWDACIGGIQSRSCTDLNGCTTQLRKPAVQRSCVVPAVEAPAPVEEPAIVPEVPAALPPEPPAVKKAIAGLYYVIAAILVALILSVIWHKLSHKKAKSARRSSRRRRK